jgi:arylsulfatase
MGNERRSMTTLRHVLAACLVSLVVAGATPAAERPNVLILLTDDQGYGDLSLHGNPVLKTPNFDRLAGESVRLTDFHVAPMCTPTRGQLLSGMDAVRNGATSVTAGRSFLRPGIPTLPQLFAAACYRTGIFGKWHLGDNYPHRPMDKVFQEAVYHLGWGFTSAPEMTNRLFDGRYFHQGEPKQFRGYCTDFWFDSALTWMQERKRAGEPFLCYLPTNAPHAPHIVAEKYAAPYQGRGPAEFFGMIANIDENLGRLETFLADCGLEKDTIVIAMTDNGGTAGVNLFNAGMRGRKTTYYEGGHRTFCFIRWPAGRLASREIAIPTQAQDLLPTLLDLCGIERPRETKFDGVSLAPLLRGEAEQLADRMLVVQYGQEIQKWDACVIWNRWRLVKGEELYDVASDPGQSHNYAADHPDVLRAMRDHYERWWAGVAPLVDDFVPTSLGSDKQPVVELTSSDWQGVYADNSRHIGTAAGGPRGGPWNVLVEQEGEYEFAARRWPRELDLPLSAANGPNTKALPIAAARLKIGEQELQAVAKGKEAVFRVPLSAGQTKLHVWFQDAAGNDLCGAYFVTVRRR